MIVWGLLVSLARAEPADPPPAPPETTPTLEERLLGDPAVQPPPDAEPLPVVDTFSWWPLLLAAAGAGLLWWTRRRLEAKQSGDGSSELRVVGRAELGGQSGVAVVEVRDRQGTWRRLVIGTGGGGAPQLVADLGEPQFGLLGEDDDSTVEEVAPLTPPSAPSRSLGGDLPRDFDRYDPLPSPSEAGLPPLPADPRSGRALVHEVLGERRRKAKPTRRSTSFQTFA